LWAPIPLPLYAQEKHPRHLEYWYYPFSDNPALEEFFTGGNMSLRRKMLRAAQMNLDAHAIGAHKLTQEEVKQMKDVLLNTAKDKKSDPRSKAICANNLLVHDLEVRKYLEPPLQRSEMEISGLPAPPKTLSVRIIGPDKKKVIRKPYASR
jgi:hypothetical protein